MVASEEEIVETALLRYAQQAATKWGAERFAAEFMRRDLEERWVEAARSNTSPYRLMEAAEDRPERGSLSGLVDDAVQERVVGSDPGELSLNRPKYGRHPSVPRPPEPEVQSGRRRARRLKRDRATKNASWVITPAQAAGMSPAGRRLYGLDDPPNADRR
jgi:hypothetical protein